MGHSPDHVVANNAREHEHGVVLNKFFRSLGTYQQREAQNCRGKDVFTQAIIFRFIHYHGSNCGLAGLGFVWLRNGLRRPVGFAFPRDEHAADDVILQIHIHFTFRCQQRQKACHVLAQEIAGLPRQFAFNQRRAKDGHPLMFNHFAGLGKLTVASGSRGQVHNHATGF